MDAKQKDISLAGVGAVFGVAFGYVVGSFVGNVGLWIALGSAVGLLFALVIRRRDTV
jgi:large-conductance mechanosensitive channel